VRSLWWLATLGLATCLSASATEVDSLVRVLRDPAKDSDAKGEACLELMDLGPAAAPAVTALVSLLKSPDEVLRDYAVTTLDRIGPPARNALPALRRTAAQDLSPDIRTLARAAIAKIGGGSAEAEPAKTTGPEGAPSVGATPENVPPPLEVQPPKPPARVTNFNEAAPVTISSEPVATTTEVQPAKPPPPPPRSVVTIRRPILVVHEGKYFRWSVPVGWADSESANGVTLTAPDGLTSVSAAVLLHSKGQTTPSDLTLWMLGMIPEYQALQVVTTKSLPDQPSGLAKPWNVQELDVRFAVNGVPVRALWTTGVVPLEGLYDAFILGYQTKPAGFETDKFWLAHIARSIAIINRTQVAGTDKFLTPKNNALDNSALVGSWREKGQSEDRIWKIQRDGTMGYERVKDPETGGVFEIPMEAWDSAAGGYHNPLKPAQIVQSLEPGE
jgi:hypothetical protein